MQIATQRTVSGVRPVVIVVLGPRGSGKTLLAAKLAPDMAPRERLLVVAPVPTLSARTGLPWHRLSASNPDGVEQFLRRIESDAADHGVHRFLVIDEFDEYCRHVGYVTPAVYDLINYGRNYGLGCLVVARGNADVTTNVLNNADAVFVFRTMEPNACDYLRRWMADDEFPDPISVVRALPRYVAMVWVPAATPKFQGYVTVKGGVIREWKPSEGIPEETPDSADAKTDEGNPTDSAGGVESVESPSATADGRTPAKTITPNTPPSRIGSVRRNEPRD